MKKHYFLYLLLVCSIAPVSAITQMSDSLYAVWEDQDQSDSTRVQAFYSYIINGFIFSQPDSAFKLAEKIISFSQLNGYKEGEAMGLSLQGVSFYTQGNFIKALDYYQKSLKIKEELHDQIGQANTMNNIGLIYSNFGDYPKALNYYKRCLQIYEKTSDEYRMASTLNNIGLIYNNQRDYSKALDYYQRSLKIHQKENDEQKIALGLNNIGLIYASLNDKSKAINYYQRSLSISEKIQDQNIMALALNNLGHFYLDQGKYTDALSYFQSGLKHSKIIGNKSGMSNALYNIGQTYYLQGQFSESIEYCRESLQIAKDLGILEGQKNACECLYNSYKALKNSENALVFLEKTRWLEDSLKSEKTNEILQNMEFKKVMLQDSISKAEEARLIKEAYDEEMRIEKQRRNWSIAGGVLFLIIAGSFYNRWRYVKKSKAIIEKEKDRSEKLLLNILPAEIAEELKEKGKAEARNFEMVSILFTDFKGFTQLSEKMSASELVQELNHCFKAFDHIMNKYGVEKIKTIGDAYMAAGGLPVPDDDSVENTIRAALEIQEFMQNRKLELSKLGKHAFEMRLGIHTGSVAAGIVGMSKFQYDIWGDSVNTASRMESSGEVGKVNISETTFNLIKNNPGFIFESRGKIQAKGKGEIEMYFVSKRI